MRKNDTLPQQWHSTETSSCPASRSQPLTPCPHLLHLPDAWFHSMLREEWCPSGSQQSEAAVETSPLYQEEFMKPVTPLCQEVRGAQPLITANPSAWRPIIFILSYLIGCLQAVKATQPQLNTTRKHNRTLSFYGPSLESSDSSQAPGRPLVTL